MKNITITSFPFSSYLRDDEASGNKIICLSLSLLGFILIHFLLRQGLRFVNVIFKLEYKICESMFVSMLILVSVSDKAMQLVIWNDIC